MSQLRNTKLWTPGWYPGYFSTQLHNLNRAGYDNTFNISYVLTPYTKGVLTLGVTQFLWMVIALGVLLLAELRRYFTAQREALYTYLYICICTVVCAFLALICFEWFLHNSVLLTIPTLSMHPADNGEIAFYMKNLEDQVLQIKKKALERSYSFSASMFISMEAVTVYEVQEKLRQASDSLILGYKNSSEARTIHTPLQLLVVSAKWVHFVMMTFYWTLALVLVAILFSKEFYTAATVVGLVLSGLGACLLTIFALVVADACFDPRYTLYTLKDYKLSFHQTEERALRSEYQRVCEEWYSNFTVSLDQYKKEFMHAAFDLRARSKLVWREHLWLYLSTVSEKLNNISNVDVEQLYDIPPPQCQFTFPDITSPSPVPKRLPNISEQTMHAPRFIPPYDVVMRALCSTDKKLNLLVIEIATLLVALAIVTMIMCAAFIWMTPRKQDEVKKTITEAIKNIKRIKTQINIMKMNKKKLRAKKIKASKIKANKIKAKKRKANKKKANKIKSNDIKTNEIKPNKIKLCIIKMCKMKKNKIKTCRTKAKPGCNFKLKTSKSSLCPPNFSCFRPDHPTCCEIKTMTTHSIRFQPLRLFKRSSHEPSVTFRTSKSNTFSNLSKLRKCNKTYDSSSHGKPVPVQASFSCQTITLFHNASVRCSSLRKDTSSYENVLVQRVLSCQRWNAHISKYRSERKTRSISGLSSSRSGPIALFENTPQTPLQSRAARKIYLKFH